LALLEEINKEFATLVENDTLNLCKEHHVDRRIFVSYDSVGTSTTTSPAITSTTTTTSSTQSSQKQLPTIYFVTPTYPR
jgi:hypothetical protein